MPLIHTEDQSMLADTVRSFLADHAPVSHMRALRDQNDPQGFSSDLWSRFAELGLNGVLVDEADGGAGLGHVEAGIVLEEIGRNLTPSPFLSTAVGCATALRHATAEQKAAWLPRIAAGEAVGAVAIDEAPRHRPEYIGLRADQTGTDYRLTGEKRFVLNGHAADFLIVAARTAGAQNDHAGITLFLIEPDLPGMTIHAERLIDASLAARVTFDNVVVPAATLLGELDHGFQVLSPTLDALRVGAAAEMIGVGTAAFAMTVSYLAQRKQFNRLIGSFQALQHRAAHLYSELEVARAAVISAQQRLDAGDADASTAVGVAKAMSGLASALAVQESIQMHGGIGMTDECDIGFYMKRQRVLAEFVGDTDYHANLLADRAGY